MAARMQHDVGLKVLGGRTHTLICGAGALDPSVAEWYGSLSVAGKPLQFIGALSPALPPQHVDFILNLQSVMEVRRSATWP